MPKTVNLFEPIRDAAGATIEQITLRDPIYRDFVELAAPFTLVNVGAASSYIHETPSLVGAWLERLVDCDPALLLPLPLEDALALRDALAEMLRPRCGPAPADGAAERFLTAFDETASTPN